jgi:hypothetical protein
MVQTLTQSRDLVVYHGAPPTSMMPSKIAATASTRLSRPNCTAWRRSRSVSAEAGSVPHAANHPRPEEKIVKSADQQYRAD